MGGGVGRHPDNENKCPQKDGPVQGGQRSPSDLDSRGGRSCFLIVGTRVTRVYAVWEHSGLRVTCHPDPSVGTRWNLGELSESVAQRLSE